MQRLDVAIKVVDLETGQEQENHTVSLNLLSTNIGTIGLDLTTLASVITRLVDSGAPTLADHSTEFVMGYGMAVDKLLGLRRELLEALDAANSNGERNN